MTSDFHVRAASKDGLQSLCKSCRSRNAGIGLLADDVENLRRALDYLLDIPISVM